MESALRRDEGKMHFTGYPRFCITDGNEAWECELEDALSKLLGNTDSVDLSFGLYIEWEDPIGNRNETLLVTGSAENIREPIPFGATNWNPV